MYEADPTVLNNTQTCIMINPYLYGDGEDIAPNPDVSGIGVRRTIYVQALLNQLVAMGHRTYREAIAINAANAVAMCAIAVASAYILHPDWVHLLIIYHFLLLISFSGITYNTVRPSFRQKTAEFGRLIERLCIIDMFAFPLCFIISAVLWIGIMVDRHQKRFYPVVACNFGKYVMFGQVVDLESSNWFLVAMGFGLFWIAWSVFSMVTSTIMRFVELRKARRAVVRYYGPHPPSEQRSFPADCEVRVTGDYVSAWIWQWSETVFGDGIKVYQWKVGFREVIIITRLLFWLYLVVTNEQLITVNNLQDENIYTFGQIFPLILLVIPISELWKYCYREFASFRHHFDSYVGHNQILYSLGALVATVQAFTIFAIVPFSLFTFMLWMVTLISFITIEYTWSLCSVSFDKLFGNEVYLPASSYWEIIFTHHEIKLPSQTIQLGDLQQFTAPGTPNDQQEPVLPPVDSAVNTDVGGLEQEEILVDSPIAESDIDITEVGSFIDRELVG